MRLKVDFSKKEIYIIKSASEVKSEHNYVVDSNGEITFVIRDLTKVETVDLDYYINF